MKYYIIPKFNFEAEIEATDKEDAIARFAASADASDLNQYLQVVTKEELEEIREEMSDSAAHARFVTAFMRDELIGQFDVPEEDAQNVAEEAYDIYCEGNGQTEYECIEEAFAEYKKNIAKLNVNTYAEFKGQVIDIFEDFCEENGITINNPDKEEYDREAGYAPGENIVIIFGDDYDAIGDEIIDSDGLVGEADKIIRNAVLKFSQILVDRGNRDGRGLKPDEVKVLERQVKDIFKAWEVT